jgi:hypothetical protein
MMTPRLHGILCVLVLALALTGNAAPFLSIDFNHRTNNPATTTFPGFTSFIITSNISVTTDQTNATIRTIDGYRITLTGNGINRGYIDRSHALPTNQAGFTESLLLRDGVYCRDTTTSGGLNLQVENLPPSNRVQVTVWSFDLLSEPIQASDWYANTTLVRYAYQFTNSIMPTRNEQYRFSFMATVSASGQLLIQGRRNPMSIDAFNNRHPGVFLNALRIDPEPLEILATELNGNELRLTFVVRAQPAEYVVEETTGGQWQGVNGVVYSGPVNNRVTARFARPNGARLYRVRYD